ncbi:hypothetical protein N0V95_007200 [Ascochyta clinopodiicola]|nr:hypothetical protein N0V95_007200 [Ascochyta clinopodiicola]
MYDFDFDIPTLLDQRITQYILELNSIDVLMCCQIPDLGKLERRRDALNVPISCFIMLLALDDLTGATIALMDLLAT